VIFVWALLLMQQNRAEMTIRKDDFLFISLWFNWFIFTKV
jgi:hypothetical protein